jgi:hypothetical protein
MPYIKSDNDRREKLRNGESALTAGELNYQIFYFVKHSSNLLNKNKIDERIIRDFIEQFLGENPNYQRYNDMTGALIRCYVEIKRRLGIELDLLLEIVESYNEEINKYEDTKIIENGDVE